jgi:hypothetical protein
MQTVTMLPQLYNERHMPDPRARNLGMCSTVRKAHLRGVYLAIDHPVGALPKVADSQEIDLQQPDDMSSVPAKGVPIPEPRDRLAQRLSVLVDFIGGRVTDSERSVR